MPVTAGTLVDYAAGLSGGVFSGPGFNEMEMDLNQVKVK